MVLTRFPEIKTLDYQWDNEEEFFEIARSMGFTSGKLFVGGQTRKFLEAAKDRSIFNLVEEALQPEEWDRYYQQFCFYAYTNAQLDTIAKLFNYRDRESITSRIGKFIDLLHEFAPSDIKLQFPRKTIKPKRYLAPKRESKVLDGSKNDKIIQLLRSGLSQNQIMEQLNISINNYSSRVARLKGKGLI